jgi:hypothetical protein
MQSIKCFYVSRLWKTNGCLATFGAIQSRPVQNAAGEKVSAKVEIDSRKPMWQRFLWHIFHLRQVAKVD